MPTQEQRFTPFRTVGGRTSLALRPQPRTDCRALHKHTTSLNGITLCAAHSSSAAELLHQLARHLCAPLRMRTTGHAARAAAAGPRASPPTMSCRRSGSSPGPARVQDTTCARSSEYTCTAESMSLHPVLRCVPDRHLLSCGGLHLAAPSCRAERVTARPSRHHQILIGGVQGLPARRGSRQGLMSS